MTEKTLSMIKSTLVSRRELIYSIMSSLSLEETEIMYAALKKLRDEMPKHIELARKAKAGELHPVLKS